MNNDKFPQHFWGLVVLAIGLVAMAAIGASAVVKVKRAADVITVTGSAKKSITSDYVTWNGSVNAQERTLPAAYAGVQKYTDRVKAFFKEKSVPENTIKYDTIYTETLDIVDKNADGSETHRTEFRITQSFSMGSSDVKGVTALSNDITALLNEGVPLNSNPPQYMYTKLADIRIQMLADATKDAKMRADSVAKSAGGRIGAVRNARMGVFQITQPFSTDVSDYGTYDTSTIDKDITAVVSITFALE